MNRAILIVICDFIVSAMLSLFTGNSAVGTAAGTRGAALDNRTAVLALNELRRAQTELEKERRLLLDAQYARGVAGDNRQRLAELTSRLAEVQAHADMLEQKVHLGKQETGRLTQEALQKKLEKEIAARYRLHLKKEETERELAALRRLQTEAEKDLNALRSENAARKGQLEFLSRQQQEQARHLEETRAALLQSREAVAVRNAEMQTMRREMRVLQLSGEELAGKRLKAEADLAYIRGRLNATEQELAEAQSRSDRSARQLTARDLELKDARRQLEVTQKQLKNAVTDLSATRAKLAEVQETAGKNVKALAQASGELAAARSQLKTAQGRLQSDVQKLYNQAVVRLNLVMEETRLLIPTRREGTYYLPVVEAGGRICVIGELPNLTGNVRVRPDYADVTSLGYSVQGVDGKDAAKPLPGPLYSLRQEPSMVFLEVRNMPGVQPLKVLNMSELKQRGVQDLYLFKSSALGRESASLGGRCSLDREYFYIRNAARGTGSELRAEPGDFVLTKQGEFVALVTDVVTSDLGRKQMARCVMVPDQVDWNSVTELPFRNPGDIRKFSAAASPLLKQIREREQKIDLR